ncbi:MAG: dihydroxyacetone kinase subunit DhaK [Spirochaetia bacterium]|jgi:dihydroxyacetone kinase-like protein
MKKLINDPRNVVSELIEGFVLANEKTVYKHPKVNAAIRRDAPVKDKVGIVIGGGAGHEPLFLEYIGRGMADASAHGQVFAAPAPVIVYEAIKAVDSGKGVILLYNNYAGDVLNFDMAQEMAVADGIKVETVLINDEIASAPKGKEAERRGTTADHIIIKIAGGAAERRLPFEEVVRITRKAIAGARSLGVALSSCTLPATGKEIFDLPDDKIEIGMGLHGEPGFERIDLLSADRTVEKIIPRIIEDLPYKKGDEVVLIVNGYGATTRMELLIANRRIRSLLADLGIKVHGTEIGEFCTSQEMKGLSITLIRLDDELKGIYDMPCDSAFYKKVVY